MGTGRPPIQWSITVRHYPCPACGAAPGAKCVTTHGDDKSEPHADRSRLAAADDWKDPDE